MLDVFVTLSVLKVAFVIRLLLSLIFSRSNCTVATFPFFIGIPLCPSFFIPPLVSPVFSQIWPLKLKMEGILAGD